jgi:cardiolipin synthase
MAQHIDRAKKSIEIQHPKYVDLAILERITEAFARGVKVRVLCSGTHGVRAWDRVETFSSLRLLQKIGVPVHRMKRPKLHAKLIVVDDRLVFTGSMNIHHRAFDERRELGIILDDEAIVKRLVKTFHDDWHESHKFEVPDPLMFDQHEDHGDVGD